MRSKFIRILSLTLAILIFVKPNSIFSSSVKSDVIELYDVNGEVVAYYITSGQGYQIIERDLSGIIEMSESSKVEFIEENYTNGNKIIYERPLSYFKTNDFNEFLDDDDNIVSKSTISTFETESSVLSFSVDLNADAKYTIIEPNAPGITNHYISSFGLVPNYSYNPNGICGSTAAAMLLMYYDKKFNNSYVPSNLESSSGITLIKHLVPYIDGLNPGSTMNDAFNGLNNYLSSRGFSKTARKESRYSLNLNYGPAMLDLGNNGSYGEHWVVAYGYRKYTDIALYNVLSEVSENFNLGIPNATESYLIYVVDGHGNKGVLIDLKYIEGALYLR